MAAPFLVIAVSPAPPPVNFIWDWANALGYIALVLCLLLFVYAGRPRAVPPFSGRFFANLHRDLGYLVLVLLAAHIGLLIYTEPLLIEHLKPTAPHYMAAGLLATVLMVLLILSSITRLRKKLWQDYHLFRRVHAVAAVLSMGFLLWHVFGSRYYLNHQWKLGLVALAAAAVLAVYAYERYRRHPVPQLERVRNSSRFSHWISYGSVTVVVLLSLSICLLVLMLGGSGEE